LDKTWVFLLGVLPNITKIPLNDYVPNNIGGWGGTVLAVVPKKIFLFRGTQDVMSWKAAY